ncbi:arylsulfatase A-like enzyme [Scopulibacillus darangshiensis]|uniref:Arylsulfatase A-like enzyme n=1 Tax=Scopulibacillus darangshiensis TaxID=442528 RepID=A0A4V6NQH1_9BACL|nr:sulfatase-like hydrolase/transferase [Scopulibacillus darangshiensis]TCP22666.1 arylsulfatase A-like enzyme [Scopulibacillus darangshiensis]
MNVIAVIMDTLRRDHLSCYGTEKPSNYLNQPIATPNLDEFAAMGTLFQQAYLGSFPCMPARRDLWTGRYEFPWRSWGPLEDEDLDFINLLRSYGWINMLISDHYHLLERDAGNYHFGFNGWDMIRGQEHDPYITDPLEDGSKENIDHLTSGAWYLHQKNKHGEKRYEEDLYGPQVFRRAISWLERNALPQIRENKPFFLMIESFDPHEPWDPPSYRAKGFDPNYQGKLPHSPVYGSAERFSEAEIRQMRALYAGEVTMIDDWFGRLLDKVDQLELWDDTLIIITTDHGFFLGEHGLIGKPDLVPLYSEMSHIPLMIYHPHGKRGYCSNELVQLVDLFPTITDALDISLLKDIRRNKWIRGTGHRKAWEGINKSQLNGHGKSLLPLVQGERRTMRSAAFSGKFGDIVRVCDGKWALYLTPCEGVPLYWYGTREPGRTFAGRRGVYDLDNRRYPVTYPVPRYTNALYNLEQDPDEKHNVIDQEEDVVISLMQAFKKWLQEIGAPSEVTRRYGVPN